MFKLLNKAAHSFRENEMTHISCCYHHYQMKINIVEFESANVCNIVSLYIKTGFVGFDVYNMNACSVQHCATVQLAYLYDVTMIAHINFSLFS